MRRLPSISIPEGKLLLAFSGGEDSLCLMHCLSQMAGDRSEALYINHGIRSREELEAEERRNAENAALLGIPLHIIRLDREEMERLSAKNGTEGAARELRYKALETYRREHGFDWILTAHHREDQAETVIMRILSSAPIWAYSGIQRCEGHIFRPLLEVPKCEISEAVGKIGLIPSTDSTNSDTSYMRNSIRASILPYLSEEAKEHLSSIALKCQMIKREPIPIDKAAYWSIDRELFGKASLPEKEASLFIPFRKRVSRALIAEILEKRSGSLEASGLHFYITSDEIRIYEDIPDFAIPFCERDILSFSIRFRAEDDQSLRISRNLIREPALFRKSREGDRIRLREGEKKVKAMEKDWRIPYSIVLEDREGIAAVFARVFGGRDRLAARFLGNEENTVAVSIRHNQDRY